MQREGLRKGSLLSKFGREVEEEVCSDSCLNLDMGFSHMGIHAHSWRPLGPKWIWVPKDSLEVDLGYPASKEDIRRFGYAARKVRRVGPPPPLLRSFASAVGENNMARREEDRSWKRRQEDWMEEDDLLEEDFRQERDMRFKL